MPVSEQHQPTNQCEDTMTNTPMTTEPFRPTNPDADVPVVWANNEANEFPPAWWASMHTRLYKLATRSPEYLDDDDHSLELSVAITLSEVAARVVRGTNPGGPNTIDAEPDQGIDRAQYRLWGTIKLELPAAVRYVRKLRRNSPNVAAYAPTDTGARKRLLGERAYVAPQDRPKSVTVMRDTAATKVPVKPLDVHRHATTTPSEGAAEPSRATRGMDRLEHNNVVRSNPYQGTIVRHAPGVRGGGVREESLTPRESRRRMAIALQLLRNETPAQSRVPLDELFLATADSANPVSMKELAERFGVHVRTVQRAIDRLGEVAPSLADHILIDNERPKQTLTRWQQRRRVGWAFDYALPSQPFVVTFTSLKTGDEVTATGRRLQAVVDAMVREGYERAGLEDLALYFHQEVSERMDPLHGPDTDYDDLDEMWASLPEGFEEALVAVRGTVPPSP
jgi:AraC-like DNA-binding protein